LKSEIINNVITRMIQEKTTTNGPIISIRTPIPLWVDMKLSKAELLLSDTVKKFAMNVSTC
jgi:hypothetical protein